MAYEIPNFQLGVLAADIDMSNADTYQYTPVRARATSGVGVSGAAALAPVAVEGDQIVGVLQNNPQLAEAGTVMVEGVTKAKAAGTIAVGDKLMAATAGGFKVGTTGLYGVATALEPAVLGDTFSILLQNHGVLP